MCMRQLRADELLKWGYEEGHPPEGLAAAEASAEAASALDRIVPLSSLAYRRFRIEVVEPLLAIPKAKKGKGKKGKLMVVNRDRPQVPKGRLARSVKALLEESDGDSDERRRMAHGMAVCLQTIGVRTDHPLRLKLAKYLAATTSPAL